MISNQEARRKKRKTQDTVISNQRSVIRRRNGNPKTRVPKTGTRATRPGKDCSFEQLRSRKKEIADIWATRSQQVVRARLRMKEKS